MKRRDFLKQAGTAAFAASATVSGPFVHASDKASSTNAVIGKGEHRYECFHGWGDVPDSVHWDETHGVAGDKAHKDGNIFVAEWVQTGRVSFLRHVS